VAGASDRPRWLFGCEGFCTSQLDAKSSAFSRPSDREEKKCSTVGTATFDGDLKAIHVSHPALATGKTVEEPAMLTAGWQLQIHRLPKGRSTCAIALCR